MKIPFVLAVGAAASVAMATPVTLDFDSIATGGGGVGFTSYGGMTWTSVGAVDNGYYNSIYSNSVTFSSSPNAMFNSGGTISASATNGADFDLIGMDVATFAGGDAFASHSSTSITVEGWDDGVMVGSFTTGLSVSFASFGTAFSSIDEIRFINDGQNGRWWLVDDMVVDFSPQSIPLPTTSAMAGLGLLGLGVRRRRATL